MIGRARKRCRSEPDAQSRHHTDGPLVLQIVVLSFKALISGPTHAGRLGRELVFLLGGTAPHVVQTLGDLVGPTHGPLLRRLALRCVRQAMASPASEVAPAIEFPAPPAASGAPQPLPAASELCGCVGEGDKLVYGQAFPIARNPIEIGRASCREW